MSMKNFLKRIYLEAEIKVENAEEKGIFEGTAALQRDQMIFEMGAKFVLEMFSQLPREKHKRGGTESKDEYIQRLEHDIIDLQMSNAGWMCSFKD